MAPPLCMPVFWPGDEQRGAAATRTASREIEGEFGNGPSLMTAYDRGSDEITSVVPVMPTLAGKRYDLPRVSRP